MWLKWLPWKMIVRQTAQSHGFIDPLAVLSHLRRFAQPSEVHEPIELMRAGAVFHARGFMNSRIIQHNLDWVWPCWVVRQFSPSRDTFIPRAFSLTHVNLSGRNWTAVGLPGSSQFPIVDPCGLLTPWWNGWSIDAWIYANGKLLAPSRLTQVRQQFSFERGIAVETSCQWEDMALQSSVWADVVDGEFVCRLDVSGQSRQPGWLILSLRPYNPEGVSFIHSIELTDSNKCWLINDKQRAFLETPPDSHKLSAYLQGDVALLMDKPFPAEYKMACDVGMVTAAAMYKLQPDVKQTVRLSIPLADEQAQHVSRSFRPGDATRLWDQTLQNVCRLQLPDEQFVFLYDAAVRASILHSPLEIYPGPFTYKRFWFRDAAFILQALIAIGKLRLAQEVIDAFLRRQTTFGYFHSQAGEWDSNGQVLWIMNVFCKAANVRPRDAWLEPILKGAAWIIHKRMKKQGTAHDGLLPAGFSAEHLGPNDFYYWDDFWSVAGLRAAGEMLGGTARQSHAAEFAAQADDLLASIESSLLTCRDRLKRAAMPASPYRRLDSGAIGSLVAGYPLDLFEPDDPRLSDLTYYLLHKSVIDGGFFHDIIHSGINPYLTLHLAQVLMRAGDPRFIDSVRQVARLASPTGQWPEAINPRTAAGCMGDGQHIWSAAEWLMMMIRLFVIEQGDRLILAAGIFPEWLARSRPICIGPVMTSFGSIFVEVVPSGKTVRVQWKAQWHAQPPPISVRIPGFAAIGVEPSRNSVEINV
ncbi:MAG: hypothetical protein LLF76_11725 [Planctomycetaceae bacterium]|nr:hypothetical protein [Planctomycetaceae bacterium]